MGLKTYFCLCGCGKSWRALKEPSEDHHYASWTHKPDAIKTIKNLKKWGWLDTFDPHPWRPRKGIAKRGEGKR